MNWAWAASLDHIWRSPNLPLYLTLATAGLVGVIVLITLLRSERSVANGVLALITLLAIGVAGAVTFRGFGTANVVQSTEARPVQTATAPLPQLSCIDELAGDVVLAACEKALFGSAESVAAAVAYAASQITLLTSLGDVATANKGAGSDLQALRRAVERDRYGLMAYVLTARDRCTPSACRAFRSLTETRQIAANMEDRVYESLVMRYAASWNAPQAVAGMIAALPPSVPTGKPTNAEFPTSASTPPVNIMTPEPPLGAAPKPSSAAAAPASPAAPRPAAATPPASPQAQAAAKKPPPAPKRPSSAPVQLAPSAAAPTADNNE
ncbi:hypothetical protein [Bradyrhizobium sp. AUGA SZCCT0283]|uniref:hypothetical protein n=1 Tax=Bradyrhizobium sp. AUGA SZCCT0283 TaxID=2807671 RepID=UPI001BA95589|nr:hypothetical protein [Bradyrhizobium sp. AUGA SZCCT0283]MBR1278163.1 hypothetical protein [Bradyrhizobium sp. AUGA SZCCT0283]